MLEKRRGELREIEEFKGAIRHNSLPSDTCQVNNVISECQVKFADAWSLLHCVCHNYAKLKFCFCTPNVSPAADWLVKYIGIYHKSPAYAPTFHAKKKQLPYPHTFA